MSYFLDPTQRRPQGFTRRPLLPNGPGFLARLRRGVSESISSIMRSTSSTISFGKISRITRRLALDLDFFGIGE